METVLWQVLAGTEGGPNRVRILRVLDERPRNRHRLADDLSLNYKTVEHHLDVLSKHGLVEHSDSDYGAVYFPTETAQEYWSVIERIAETTDA
ncbi:ArsR/SmtB family transcription factor [Haloarcula nitratireducens]|uniref:Winged helix-turn-helix domain-containing protein n=1 Tax=Haloarcula nitratireducens TaxID=2487749 RepID=A0AAW4PGE9_9EURY|nr:winged helix-turn-helix domain-containing protein [Halomicroarcula nitratireducens]MBX0297167.1 winged helix-turn-helix domain-containing protein [Halomicroarcula nitratireducens]